jgi:hypothetical protein
MPEVTRSLEQHSTNMTVIIVTNMTVIIIGTVSSVQLLVW